MNENPETHEAVERWHQGKINIFDEMARLERERDEALASIDGLCKHFRAEGIVDLGVKLLRLERERNNLQDQRDFAMSEIERLQYQLRHAVSQRDIAWASRPYLGGKDSAVLELGATQAAVAEVLGLTATPTTADEVRQALRGVVGLAEALAKTQVELKKERDEARETFREIERENEQLLASNKTYERDWPVLVHERDEARAERDEWIARFRADEQLIKDAMIPHPENPEK